MVAGALPAQRLLSAATTVRPRPHSACVEVGTVWRKSSYSGNGGANCVEVARALPQSVAVRDSKDPRGPVLTMEPAEWQEFITEVKAGRHDLA